MDGLTLERQKELHLDVPKAATVVGCGGVGWWTALFAAMSGVKLLLLYDGDVIEETNRNRLPVRLEDVGRPKVDALREAIYAIRPETAVVAFPVFVNPDGWCPTTEVVFDCTDRLAVQKGIYSSCKSAGVRYIKGGYDGLQTMVTGDAEVWMISEEEDTGYQVIPSWVIPAALVAALGCLKAMKVESLEWFQSLETLPGTRT